LIGAADASATCAATQWQLRAALSLKAFPNYVSRSFGLVIMISHITDLKISLYSAAISASAAFVQREASIYGTFFAIVLALGRSLARVLCRFLPEKEVKMRFNRKQPPARPNSCHEMFIGCYSHSLCPLFLH
jgi:hypothetical protein